MIGIRSKYDLDRLFLSAFTAYSYLIRQKVFK